MVSIVPSSLSTRKPYGGTRTTIVIAIDVGTTFSGVSYAILRPAEIPNVQGVTRFPDQDSVAGDKKVPSVLYYDSEGEVRAAGATTQTQNIVDTAEDEGWIRVEHFKLHLRPPSMTLKTNGFKICPLPPRKTAEQVFGDFLEYLFQCTVDFIKETQVDGTALWDQVKDHAQFVLTHPNGWEGAQQQKMRHSAIQAGMIRDTLPDRQRLTFVTEGEASLHACLTSGLGPSDVAPGDSFIIADAGGGTLDINTYEVESVGPLKIQELAASDCRFAGSIFVNRFARGMIEEKLKGSRYASEDNISFLLSDFDKITKRLFADDTKPQWVTVGGPSERVPKLGIRNGKLKLEGTDVAKCFEFSINEAVTSIMKQREMAQRPEMDVWLVGGFAASPWLFQQLKTRLEPKGFNIYRPDSNTSKAVADGALAFFLDRLVTARVAKLSCGVQYCSEFNPLDPEHRSRPAYRQLSGRVVMGGQFHCFVERGTKTAETAVYRESFFRDVSPGDAQFDVEILCYTGPLPVPRWIDKSPDKFKTLCTLKADLDSLCHPFSQRMTMQGETYYHLEFDVEVKFGLTEYGARTKWIENGEFKYGPATIIFEDGATQGMENL